MTDIISNELEVYDSGVITASTTTDTHNTTRQISGEIIKVEIIVSASADFKLWVDASDDDTRAIVDQYVLGGAAATVTVASASVFYPVELMVIAAGTATDPDQFSRFFVDGIMEVSVSAIANLDTYRVLIYYKPMRVTKK